MRRPWACLPCLAWCLALLSCDAARLDPSVVEGCCSAWPAGVGFAAGRAASAPGADGAASFWLVTSADGGEAGDVSLVSVGGGGGGVESVVCVVGGGSAGHGVASAGGLAGSATVTT